MLQLPHSFSVTPTLPPALEPLRELAYNLWFSWEPQALALFRDLDPELWEASGHNPVRVLQRIPQSRLEHVAADAGFVKRVDAVKTALDTYLGRGDRWFQKTHAEKGECLIAYFSAEFGIHESLQTYSGGLGILAGDHCKAASDLGLPFVAIGLMYRQGYFIQRLNRDGWQESEHPQLDFNSLPVREVYRDGKPVRATVELPGRQVFIRGWEARVGRISIVFLDTDLPENSEEDRRITYQLYGGDHEMRIKQEIVLGIGGKRFLLAINLHPTVFHMNEGHAAFLALERIRRPVKDTGADSYAVLQTVAASNVFTTHTPVPAGNDAFSPDLVRKYFESFAEEMGLEFEEFLRFGRPWQAHQNEPFSMTILALRLSRFCNGVSKIHGGVSREMWRTVWPGVPDHEIPIGHITNGIHTQTWIAPEIKTLLNQYVGADIWETDMTNLVKWKSVAEVPDRDLWQTHQALKRQLVDFVRFNVRTHRLRNEESAASLREVQSILDPKILTIGFARRFATYKRAGLLFRDPERLQRILTNSERPMQFVFAGKAHPADEGGKKLIQLVYGTSRTPAYLNRVVFVENYDINVARHLYHGVDVWLNNPTRPLEASGTSGEKVCPNGGVNCSVLDGWWAEAWQRDINGWAIGDQLETQDPDVQNDFDADSLYTLLEHVIAPLYYERGDDGLPHRWLQFMKGSMATITPVYSTFRMVQNYADKYYVPATQRGRVMMESNYESASRLAQWKARIRQHWNEIKVTHVKCSPPQAMTVGQRFEVECEVTLGKLSDADLVVEAYVRSDNGRTTYTCPMTHQGHGRFKGTIEAYDSGRYEFNVRVLPSHELLVQKHELRLITWAA